MRFGFLDGTWLDVAALHLSTFTRLKFLTLSFYVYHYIFYRFIVKRLRPLFVGGAVQIHFD